MKPARVSQGLPRSRRLPGPAEFKSVFDNCQQRASHQHFLILAHPSQKALGHNARIGIVVSKKNVRLATQRNRIKRLVRECFRRERSALKQDMDYIVLARPGLDTQSNQAILSALASRFAQISRKLDKHAGHETA